VRWLAQRTPTSAELLRLVDGTPITGGASRTTACRSALAGWAGYGRDTSHHPFYWDANLLLVSTAEGTTTGFGLVNPKLCGERQGLLRLLELPANRRRLAVCWSATRAWPATRSRQPWPTGT
jgi:hypothetical protein